MTGIKIKIPGGTIDKSGKFKMTTKRLSVSARIAKRKKPKQTFKRGK